MDEAVGPEEIHGRDNQADSSPRRQEWIHPLVSLAQASTEGVMLFVVCRAVMCRVAENQAWKATKPLQPKAHPIPDWAMAQEKDRQSIRGATVLSIFGVRPNTGAQTKSFLEEVLSLLEHWKMEQEEIDYGPVVITGGAHKGRIGFYDDDEDKFAVVYFGSMFLSNSWFEVPRRYLRQANTVDLLMRGEEISKLIGIGRLKALPAKKNYELLLEKHYIDSILTNNYLEARFGSGEGFEGVRVFLSHSSKDKWFVRRMATDLTQLKIEPWLDEWKIRAGESIPQKIGQGIELAQFVIVVLSKNSSGSKWVEREWQSKYWDEVERNKIQVIPVLLEDCEIPQLLRGKKYADFREDYSEGLAELMLAISKEPS